MDILTRVRSLLRRRAPEHPPSPTQPVRPTIDWDLVLPVAWPATTTTDGWQTVWGPTDIAIWYVATVESYSRRLREIALQRN